MGISKTWMVVMPIANKNWGIYVQVSLVRSLNVNPFVGTRSEQVKSSVTMVIP